MTRIIAGQAGGRRLAVPAGRSTRPTSDRTREGLFSTVFSIFEGLSGITVLDLYAGSGAVGLEALSRGASDVLLIEADPGAAAVIRRNITAVGLPGVRLVHDKVDRALRRGPGEAPARQLVFADPPYSTEDDELALMLATLAGRGWLAADALVVVERDARSATPAWPPGYAEYRSRRYGETTLWYGRACGDTPAAAASTTGA